MGGSTRPSYLDQLPTFIEILFALIVAAGFVVAADHFQLATSPRFEAAKDSWTLGAFLVAYIFVIGDWLFYRKLIADLPYQKNPIRFFIDACFVFPLMFVLILFAFLAWDKDRFYFYIFTLAAWHFFVMWWYFALWWDSNKGWKDVKKSIHVHTKRWGIYLVAGILYLLFVSSHWSPYWVAGVPDNVSVVARILIFVLVVILTTARIFTLILEWRLPKCLRWLE